MVTPVWADAVAYLARRPGQWVSAAELGDNIYGSGCYSRNAPIEMVRRARKAGVPIESNRALGYRLGRDRSLICPECGSWMVRYEEEVVCYACVGTVYADLAVGRAAYEPGTRQGKAWTPEELEFVRSNPGLSFSETAQRLERTESSVRAAWASLGLGRKPYARSGQ